MTCEVVKKINEHNETVYVRDRVSYYLPYSGNWKWLHRVLGMPDAKIVSLQTGPHLTDAFVEPVYSNIAGGLPRESVRRISAEGKVFKMGRNSITVRHLQEQN